MALDNEFIGNKIREIREFHNMTQSKFAERLHMMLFSTLNDASFFTLNSVITA